jgi:uncharacterized membrane protein
MSERGLRGATALLSVLGAAITAYLVYVRQTGGAPICVSGGCETVQSSSYAEVLGVPVATLGLLGFVALLAAALVRGEWARLAQATVALSALFFGAYLFYVQVAVIGAVCQWCVATDVLVSGIAALALLRLRLAAAPAPVPPPPARSHPKRRPNGTRPRKRQAKRRARAR